MKDLQTYLTGILEKLEVRYRDTLFPPVWTKLLEHRCPLCGNRLRFSENKGLYLCKSPKHGKTFVIKKDKMREVVANLK